MLFRKEMEPRCIYCKFGADIGDDQVICKKKGIVSAGGHCRKFSYDPFRRVPPQPAIPDFSKLKDEDFQL